MISFKAFSSNHLSVFAHAPCTWTKTRLALYLGRVLLNPLPLLWCFFSKYLGQNSANLSTDTIVLKLPGAVHRTYMSQSQFMITSSNGNIFRVTGPLCGEFTGPGEFPGQRPVTRSFAVFFDLRPNKRLSKQSWGWWFETPSWSLWRQCKLLPAIEHVLGSLVTLYSPLCYFIRLATFSKRC